MVHKTVKRCHHTAGPRPPGWAGWNAPPAPPRSAGGKKAKPPPARSGGAGGAGGGRRGLIDLGKRLGHSGVT